MIDHVFNEEHSHAKGPMMRDTFYRSHSTRGLWTWSVMSAESMEIGGISVSGKGKLTSPEVQITQLLKTAKKTRRRIRSASLGVLIGQMKA